MDHLQHIHYLPEHNPIVALVPALAARARIFSEGRQMALVTNHVIS
jgi:hypothetical protein